MNSKGTSLIPEPIVQLQRRFDEFRSTQPHRRRLPETLWQAAVELARVHGLHPVARPLQLDYMGLKKRLYIRQINTDTILRYFRLIEYGTRRCTQVIRRRATRASQSSGSCFQARSEPASDCPRSWIEL
uniref:Uncharacterized protein n=1 Tax=mine drainage metagenome TaxID=410659 RepID=E6QLL6_9ZZZZ